MSLSPGGAGEDAGAQLLISASVWLPQGKADERRARDVTEPCPAGAIRAAGAAWRLDGGDRAFVWRAVSADRAHPVAFVYPVTNILEALAAAKGGPAPTPRYLLITASGEADTVWGAYAAPPSAKQVEDDLDAALNRRTSPVARIDLDTKKVAIFVPSSRKPGA